MKRWSFLRRTGAPIPVAVMTDSFPNCRTDASLFRHTLRPGGDRLHDVMVAGATAQIAVELVTDGLVVEIVALAIHHVDRSHDHARRTEAALQAVMLAEGFLHRMQLRAVGDTFDRGDLRTV